MICVKKRFFKREIYLEYIYYKEYDYEFDNENKSLLLGKPVKYSFWTGEDYKEWYVELTNTKIEKE